MPLMSSTRILSLLPPSLLRQPFLRELVSGVGISACRHFVTNSKLSISKAKAPG